MKALGIFFVAAFGLLLTGCGKSGTPSSVSGSVTYKGSPVTGGTMLFHGSDKIFPASLGPDGNFVCPSVPPGDYTVTIDTKHLKNIIDPEAMLKKMSGGASGKVPDSISKDLAKGKEFGKGGMPKYVPIPEKYADAKTSGLNVKIESGSNTKEFKLTD